MSEYELICNIHCLHKQETALSPYRGKCKLCKKKKVHGYTNPDHVPNPFGYLFLIPDLCIECSLKTKQCMWCTTTKSKL